jgi:hypothetical protein
MFGGDGEYGGDITLYNECRYSKENFSNFGKTYSLPEEMEYNSDESKSYLAGSYEF